MDTIASPAKPQWSDYLLKYTVLPLIPHWVRPNHVTVFRMVATPFVLWILLLGEYAWAIPVFLFVAFTDAIDGAMARTRNQVTNWGKIYDPVADKVLIGSVIVVFVLRELSVFLGVTILAIEATFMITAFVRLWRHGQGTVEANVWGKIKMNLQVLGVLTLLIAVVTDLPSLISVSKGSFYLGIIFAVVSLLRYGV